MPQLELGWFFYKFLLAWSFFIFFMVRCSLRGGKIWNMSPSGGVSEREWEGSLWAYSF